MSAFVSAICVSVFLFFLNFLHDVLTKHHTVVIVALFQMTPSLSVLLKGGKGYAKNCDYVSIW